MKAFVTILAVIAIGGVLGSVMGWKAIRSLRAENEALRAQAAAASEQASQAGAAAAARHENEIKKLKADAKEVFKLRGEVSQLRGGAKAISELQAANQRLTAENRSLRMASQSATLDAEVESFTQQTFPKESWEFMGYTSPEDALVSAIWTMQQGDPQAYFDSLAPEEQERMSARWQDKSESEVSEKHQSDVAAISGLQILDRRDVSDTEVLMDVYIDGVDRTETVSMQRVGDEWKFKGYIQDEVPVQE